MIKKQLQKLVGLSGYELRKRQPSRQSMKCILEQVAKYFSPSTVIDVGAAFGSWTRECHQVFPQAKYVMIEPLSEYANQLQQVCSEVENAIFVPAIAQDYSGESVLHVHEDLVGSSIKNEVEGGMVDGQPRTIASVTLDALVQKEHLHGSYLVKIDVQGAELDVLKGAEELCMHTECFILEVSLFRSFVHGADLYDVVVYMKERGFVVYDIASLLYRPFDNALCQMDIVFVRETGPLRSFLGYATPEQREQQNKKFKEFNNRLQ